MHCLDMMSWIVYTFGKLVLIVWGFNIYTMILYKTILIFHNKEHSRMDFLDVIHHH